MDSNLYNNALTEKIDRDREQDFKLKLEEEKLAEQEAEQQRVAAQEEAAKAQKEAEGVNDAGDFVKEVAGSAAGGIVKAASDLITTPERLVDLAKGDVDGNYEPDWNPLKGVTDYLKPKTWYGNMLQEGTSFLTAFIPIAGQVGKVGKLATIGGKTGTIVRGAVAGGLADVVKEDTYTQDSLSQKLYRLSGGEFGDNAMTRTLLNIVENMGLGVIADYGLAKMFPKIGLDDVSQKIAARNQGIKDQTIERGKQQLKERGFGGFKNKPVADAAQGNAVSKGNPDEIRKNLDEINNDVRQADGSTPSFYTPAQIARASSSAAMSEKVFLEALGQNVSESKKAAMLKYIKEEQKLEEPDTLMKKVITRLGGSLDGRTVPMEIEEIGRVVDEIMSGPMNLDEKTGVRTLLSEEILTFDVLLGSLEKNIRDKSRAALEVGDTIDTLDKDGLLDQAKQIREVLLFESKRARRRLSSLRDLRKDSKLLPVDDEALMAEVKETSDFLDKLMRDDPTGDLKQAVAEFNSMGGKIANYEDLDNWARATMNGFNDGQRKNTGLLVRELNSMMVNSVLSSPKTPMRALIGTVANTVNREYSLLTGSLLRAAGGDTATAKIAVSEMAGMVKAVPEAFELFKRKLKGYWSNDMATLKTRYIQREREDLKWQAYGTWVESRGSAADKAAYRFGNMVRGINDSNLFTYSSKLMMATDDAFKVIIARGRARSQAMAEALENSGGKVTKEALNESQDRFYAKILDANGDVNMDSDVYTKGLYEEATLTAELEGINKHMEKLFDHAPVLKPFFLFARTGVNGLAMTGKNTPIIGALMNKQREILLAKPNNLEGLAKYGISNAQELATEQALIMGRQAIGMGAVFMMSQLYQSNRLHGNGPQNRSLRQAWIDGGWRPREVKIGDAWVSTSFFEPYSTILDAVADIHDNQEALGEKDTEDNMFKVGWIAAQAAFDKSYMQGLSQLIDALQGEGNLAGVVGTNANALIPLSSLRNDIGKLFMPYMLEHHKGFADTIRDRNRISEFGTDDPLSIKYDILTPEPIRNWNWATRVFNMMSPVQITLDYSPGRQLLFDSNYDLKTSVTMSPRALGLESIDLKDSPVVRSMFQKAMGEQNALKDLESLAKEPKVQASIATMRQLIERGRGSDIDSIDALYHNQRIKAIMTEVRKKAWNQIINEPEVQELIQETRNKNIFNATVNRQTSTQQLILPNR